MTSLSAVWRVAFLIKYVAKSQEIGQKQIEAAGRDYRGLDSVDRMGGKDKIPSVLRSGVVAHTCHPGPESRRQRRVPTVKLSKTTTNQNGGTEIKIPGNKICRYKGTEL